MSFIVKYVGILIALTISAGIAFPFSRKQVEAEALRLQGKVISVKKTVEGPFDVFDLELELEFVNAGKNPIILLGGAYDKGEWWLLNTQLSLEPENAGSAKTLIYTGGTVPADSSSMKKWKKLRAQLDRPVPPKNLTYLIAPGEKVAYRLSTFVKVPRDDRKAFERNVWLQVDLEMWPLNLEKSYGSSDFSNLLTKRWAKQGTLRVDSITSDPIPLRLQP